MGSKLVRTCVLMAGLLAGLASLAIPVAVAQKRGGTLRVYERENPPSASIHEEATISTSFPFMGLFNNLVVFDPSKPHESADTIIPDLAASWSLDEARTRLTFKLRPGVTWHDGRPFTAKDVVCTFDPAGGATEGARKRPRRIWFDNVERVIAVDDTEAAFQLRQPQPSLLSLLASGLSPVYPCHVSARDMRTKPIGTGPFKLAEFKSNEVIRLVRNPAYWKQDRPYLDGIDFRIVSSRSTRILAFEAGQFDLTFVDDVTIPLMRDVAARAPQAICELAPAGTYGNVMVNRTTPPFDNAEVRTALALTLDRRVFTDILGEGKLAIGGAMIPLPEGRWGMPADVQAKLPGYSADVARSREEGRRIMTALGYSNDNPLRIKVTTRALDQYKDPAVILIDQLRHVFIVGELNVVDSTVWYNVMQKKDYKVALNVTGVGVDDPDANLVENFLCKSERNFTNYCNSDVDPVVSQR